jgi:DNA-binding transcriptional regulator YiaG
MSTTREPSTDALHEAMEYVRVKRDLPQPSVRVAIRRAAGLSQRHVARLLGVSPTAVAFWENGARNPSHEHVREYVHLLSELARAAGVAELSRP